MQKKLFFVFFRFLAELQFLQGFWWFSGWDFTILSISLTTTSKFMFSGEKEVFETKSDGYAVASVG
jgi:hypothetical protein